MGKGNTVVKGRNGPGCPRCGQATEVREHREVTAKELAKPFYYARWFICVNRRCKTTMIMKEEHKVFRDDGVVLTTQSACRDVAMEILDEMRGPGPQSMWPPWENGPRITTFGDFWKRFSSGEFTAVDDEPGTLAASGRWNYSAKAVDNGRSETHRCAGSDGGRQDADGGCDC